MVGCGDIVRGAVRLIYSDASDVPYGGYAVGFGPEVAHGQWLTEEEQMSSTWREAEAINRVLQSYAGKLQGETVKWFTDNQAVTFVIEHGSRKPHLQQIAMNIFRTTVQHATRLEVQWIPREKTSRRTT